MNHLPPDSRWQGRIIDLPRPEYPERICLLVEDRLLAFQAPPVLSADLTLGDLVSIVAGTQGEVTALEKLGGPMPGAWDEAGDALRWRQPGKHPARMAYLRLRHRIIKEVRAYFDGEGFLEVDTPALVKVASPEPQFSPVKTESGYLITSPEFQLKRMLVGGFEKIFRLGPVFRGGETGRLHNPEFTMLEWYRTDANLEAMAADLEAILSRLAPLASPSKNTAADVNIPGGQEDSPLPPGNPSLAPSLARKPFRRVTMRELFRQYLKIELKGVVTAKALREAALDAGDSSAGDGSAGDSSAGGENSGADSPATVLPASGVNVPEDFQQVFFRLWDKIEQALPPEPLLVVDWPAPLASLARLRPSDPTLAERMELFAGGMELANGFEELTDPVEQRKRFQADHAARSALGLPPIPQEKKFLQALAQGMPPAAGMALGMDRLVMLIGGAKEIAQVLPFTWEEC